MPSLDKTFFLENDNLVTFSNSLLKAYGVPTFHDSLPKIDEILKGHKKVAVFLFDAMGELIVKDHPKSLKSFIEHQEASIYSTNPATTVAATDALLSARYPIETGWLGWSLYFKDRKQAVDVFPNRDSSTGEEIPGDNLMLKLCPYENIVDLMKQKGVKAKQMMEYPLFDKKGPRNLISFNRMATNFFKKEDGEFLYGYFMEPDHAMHALGTNSLYVSLLLKRIQKTVVSFARKNPGVLTIVLADHGQINVKYEDLAYSCPYLEATLNGPMVLEGRTPCFFVKPGLEKNFERLYKDHFGERAVLMKTDEAIEKGFFGFGKPHPASRDFLGDYVGVMLDDTVLFDSKTKKVSHFLKGHHAGGQLKERLIDLYVYNK